MTYEEFKVKYQTILKKLMKYDSDQAGSFYYAEKLGELVDEYPEFEERFENEQELN